MQREKRKKGNGLLCRHFLPWSQWCDGDSRRLCMYFSVVVFSSCVLTSFLNLANLIISLRSLMRNAISLAECILSPSSWALVIPVGDSIKAIIKCTFISIHIMAPVSVRLLFSNCNNSLQSHS